jgi:hypothetical protein
MRVISPLWQGVHCGAGKAESRQKPFAAKKVERKNFRQEILFKNQFKLLSTPDSRG